MKLTSFFYNVKNILPLIILTRAKTNLVLTTSFVYLQFITFLLKNHLNFQYKVLTCISGVDLVNVRYRFCLVYEFLSLVFNSRLRLKTYINNLTSVESITNIFINANWWEREVWDMFGIYFFNHGDLRRILTDYGFEGYALRKDFPLSGFIELRYCELKKRVIIEPLLLAQEYRLFNFDLPW